MALVVVIDDGRLCPWPSAMTSLTGFDRFTKKASFGSTAPSPRIGTVTVCTVSLAANVSVPPTAV